MNATFKQSGNKGVVTLEGDLTLPHAEALKGIFIKALLSADEVSLAMENVQNGTWICPVCSCFVQLNGVRYA